MMSQLSLNDAWNVHCMVASCLPSVAHDKDLRKNVWAVDIEIGIADDR